MADELIANTDTFSLLLAAPGLAKLPVLVLTADDGSSVAADKLIAAIHAQGGAKVQLHHEATDHSWSDRRITLEGLIIDWLQTLPAPR
jgi:hypothetical protein